MLGWDWSLRTVLGLFNLSVDKGIVRWNVWHKVDLNVSFVLIMDITHFQTELTKIPVMIRSNQGEILEHGNLLKMDMSDTRPPFLIGLPVREGLGWSFSSPLRYSRLGDILFIGPPITLNSWELSFLPFKAYDTRPLVRHYYWLTKQCNWPAIKKQSPKGQRRY